MCILGRRPGWATAEQSSLSRDRRLFSRPTPAGTGHEGKDVSTSNHPAASADLGRKLSLMNLRASSNRQRVFKGRADRELSFSIKDRMPHPEIAVSLKL
jgi:hypothetical protein